MAMEKTFNAAEAESRIYAAWETSGAFKAGANAKPGAETFSVMIPPPNVTGALHVGHAFNNTLQDILTRWHRMQGHDTLWQPGQDHAGIATQLQVEKMLAAQGLPGRRDMGREKFLEKVWEWKGQYGGTIVEQLKRLGSSCDWSRNAFTMAGADGDPRTGHENSPNFHDAVIRVFVDMYNKGLIYRGKRLVNWDPHFETAISDLEVENTETPGFMWHFKYKLAGGETYTYVEKDEDGEVLFSEDRDYISIATTRPETMLGDGAVAVHPDDARYAPIVGKMVHLPLCDRLIPIVTDEYPEMDFGSGAVKITGAHDFNDYQVAKRANLPMYRLLDTRGAMRADGEAYETCVHRAREIAAGAEASEMEIDALNLVPEKYRGLDRYEARKLVVDDITAAGLAVMVPQNDERLGHNAVPPIASEEGGEEPELQLVPLVEPKMIMQPFGDRSKVVIEPMLTDQWFVDTVKIVEPALDAVRSGRTRIMPESGEKTYFHWLENIEPWCISRQLWWGHQIPVWFDEDGKQYCAASEAEAQAQAPGKVLTRDPDVLDTWFSSGLWPIGTLGWPNWDESTSKYFPTSTLITGEDILFFWVARMMMMQLAVVDNIPFDTVYLHQLVRDEKGKKMSKTTGNVIDPLEIVDEYGADALRMTNASMAAIGGVLKLSEERIKGYRNFGTKLWNATRFAEMNGVYEHGAPSPEIPVATATVNKWIIGETARIRETVDTALAAYKFNDAALGLYAFVWGKVCDWYVELAKPLLFDEASERAETQKVMGWVIDQCLIMLHPIMPFITEELWGTTAARAKMLVHADWPTYTTDLIDTDADAEMNWVIALIEDIRSARAQMHVPAGLQVPLVVTGMNDTAQGAWDRNVTLITKLARIDTLTAVTEMPKGTITIPADGATFGLPLAEIIDVAEEKARLEKSLAKLAKEIGGLAGRLKNPKFVESAPDEVVEETRANLAARQDEEEKLKAALARMQELG
ncbi:valine--tRNA ligase [Pseudooceanicola sediminis]|uniref:Valine--tRNA ligase n=1 Tax=Pseudooceanicola sediminis TaxID=2211117 RepID=A0A399IXZ0_9RHOB|nr:valine--tRNA ligase [Pseudooceanicola sediminis]KAA2313194.1 valine--tRNA ligase [Puniceibacterium sp. HSS470]RII37840.1 valine--tRNA ligase [Pseudooceanicola sediminis]|tara:strand:- start:55135 stop:58062 length:2928 start_codon:yes stop_codon:yes gene_type:complete